MTNQPNDHTSSSLWKTLTAIAACSIPAATGGWTLGRTHLQDELSQVKQAKDWNLPETFRSMESLSKQLKMDLEMRQEFDQLKKEQVSRTQLTTAHKVEIEKLSQQFRSESEHLTKTNKQLTEDLRSAGEKIKEYEGETFTLRLGETHFVVPQVLAIGLTEASGTLKEVTVQFGEISRKLKPGMFVDTKHDGQVYRVILRSIKEGYYSNEAAFSIARVSNFEVGE